MMAFTLIRRLRSREDGGSWRLPRSR